MSRTLLIAPASGFSINAPTWELDSRDAVGSPTMTSWPLRRTGGTCTALTPLAGQEPQVGGGIVRGGIAGVLFPTTAAMASGGASASLYGGPPTDKFTIGVVFAPDEGFTNDLNCGRILSVENASINSYDHGVIHGSSAPLGGGASTQHNLGIQWPSGPTTELVRAVTGANANNAPQVVIFTYDSGVLTIERDGVTLGTRTDASRVLAWIDAYVGAAGGVGAITQINGRQPWKGTLWRVCGWVGGILTPAQRIAWMSARAAEYAISAPAWTPASIVGATGWWDSRDKYDTSGPWLGGATMDEWSNQMDADLQSRSWVIHTPNAYPLDGPRYQGRATLRFRGLTSGVGGFMQNQSASPRSGPTALVANNALSFYMQAAVRGISALSNKTGSSIYLNAMLIGDNSGFYGIFLRTDGTNIWPNAYIYGGGAFVVESSVPVVLGTFYTIGARFGGGVLTVSVNGIETSISGVNPISDVNNTTPFNLGQNGIGAVPGIPGQFDMAQLFTSNTRISNGDDALLRSWLAAA